MYENDDGTEGQDTNSLVLITGMHRSGTSALARLLSRLGLYFGDNLLGRLDGVNEDGFWEDKTILSINDEILRRLGASWYSFRPLPENWHRDPALDECRRRARLWFSEEFGYRTPSAIKDPRLCRLLPFWLDFFRQKQLDLRILFIFRHPHAVAASLAARDRLEPDVAYLLWIAYVTDFVLHAPDDGWTPVCYDTLLMTPVSVTQGLLGECLRGLPSLARLKYRRIANSSIIYDKDHHPVTPGLTRCDGVFGALAETLYAALESGDRARIAAQARETRKAFDALMQSNGAALDALQSVVDNKIALNRKLSHLGNEHSLALATLDKLQKRIEGNKDYIEKCHVRIRDQDELMKKLGKKAELAENLERAVADREKKIAQNIAYIEKCQARIRDQDEAMKVLGKKAELAENLERAVADREQKIAENVEYIARCEARIAEQDRLIQALKQSSGLWALVYAVKRKLGSG